MYYQLNKNRFWVVLDRYDCKISKKTSNTQLIVLYALQKQGPKNGVVLRAPIHSREIYPTINGR